MLSFSGCGKIEAVKLDKTKIAVDYEATYFVENTGNSIEYENVYTVKTEDGKLVVSSQTEIEYENQEHEKGMQKMTAKSVLFYDDEKMLGMPESVNEEFSIDIDKTKYSAFTFTHDHALKSGLITTEKYDKNEENGLKQKAYAVTLKEQYFDKDTLPFLLGGFPENDGVIYVSSGNRDRLQAIKYEFKGYENVATVSGTDFKCKTYLLRPNSAFAQSSATVWVSEDGKPVKVVNGTSSMLLVK